MRIAVIGAGLGGLSAAGLLPRCRLRGKPSTSRRRPSPGSARASSSAQMRPRRSAVLASNTLSSRPASNRVATSVAPGTPARPCTRSCSARRAKSACGPYVHIHRGDLHAVLARAVADKTIAFDHRLVDLRRDRRFDAPQLSPTAPPRRRISSSAPTASARKSANSCSAPSRRVRRRGRVSGDLSGGTARRLRIPDCTKWWGPDRHMPALFPDRPAR